MNKKLGKRILALCVCGLLLAGCGNSNSNEISVEKTFSTSTGDTVEVTSDTKVEGTVITLSEDTAYVDGVQVTEYDYTWCIDPSKEKPWYEGTEPSGEDAVYIAHDIVYYPTLDADSFSLETYDGEQEWVYRYTAEGLEEYIFSTLPSFMGKSEVPTEMMHTAEEAYENKVLHITKAGTYILEGTWHGQIYIDLGDKDETFTDENAKVTILLNGVDVTCDVNAAFIAYSAYECDNGWEDRSEYSGEVDTSNAGVNVVICDGTKNNFTGANVYRLLKAAYKSEGSTKQKKLYKIDGAFYSYVSMNITGEEKDTGILNITSTTFEGLDTELHLTINGGNITIYSQDDGININEDDVSVFTMNAGTLHIFAGLGREGDCVDSNGYITVNGGTIAAGTPSGSDEILDSNNGTAENGGTVITIGSSSMEMGGFTPGGGMQRPDFANGTNSDSADGTQGGDRTMPEGFDPSNMTFPDGFDPSTMTPPDMNGGAQGNGNNAPGNGNTAPGNATGATGTSNS